MPDEPSSSDLELTSDLLQRAERLRGTATVDALHAAAVELRRKGDPLSASALLREAERKAMVAPADTDPGLLLAVHLELGSIFEEELGQLGHAIEQYQRAFKLRPDDEKAIEAVRRVHGAVGDFRAVARFYELELEALSPDKQPDRRAQLLFSLGCLLEERLADLPGAATCLEEALKLCPVDEQTKERLAAIYASPDYPQSDALERASQLFLEVGQARARTGDFETAETFYKRAVGAHPHLQEAALALEALYQRAGRKEDLRRLYRQGAALPLRARKLAELALEAGELEEAADALEVAFADGDEAPEVLARLDAALSEKKLYVRLAQLHERLLGPPDSRDALDRAERLVVVAESWRKANEPRRFEVALCEALTGCPGHDDAYRLLSEHLAQKRDHAQLAAIAEAAVAAAPKDEQTVRLVELADLYEKKLGDVAAAIDAWQRARALVPSPRADSELRRLQLRQDRSTQLLATLVAQLKSAETKEAKLDLLRRTAQVHRERHELDEARRLYEEALRIRPDDTSIYRALSEIADREGRLDLVADTIRRQLAVSSERVDRLNLLRRLAALYNERLEDVDGTVWACRALLEELPGDRDALRRLTEVYSRKGPEGEAALLGVLEVHARSAVTPMEKLPLLHRMAGIYEAHGQLEEAAEQLERILKIDKNDCAAKEHLGRVYEALGRFPEAVLALERLVGTRGKEQEDVGPWRHLGRLLDQKLGDVERAERAFREVLERRPTDREALEALATIYRAKKDPRLGSVLEGLQRHAAGAAAADLLLERALLAEGLNDREAARTLLEQLVFELAPRHLEGHRALIHVCDSLGDVLAAQRVAERLLFLAEEPSDRHRIAVEIAQRWRKSGSDRRRAIAAFSRVLELAPDDDYALSELASLHAETGAFEEAVRAYERRLATRAEAGDAAEVLRLNFQLALLSEKHLTDPQRAFDYYRAAYEVAGALGQGDDLLCELERVAAEHGLWEALLQVYVDQRGLHARLRVAAIADEQLGDPKRAFAVLREALEQDIDGEKLLPLLEPLSLRAADPVGLLEVYRHYLDRAEKEQDLKKAIALHLRRAAVREARMSDPSGALDELLAAFALAPGDMRILDELKRLAAATGRFQELLEVELKRFRQARPEEQVAIALETSALLEEKLKSPLRAFRGYLQTMRLDPSNLEVRGHLFRLAAQIGTVETYEQESFSPDARVAQGRARSRDEATVELRLDDLIEEEAPPPPPLKKPPAVSDFFVRPNTIEISIDELAQMGTSGAPPPLPGGAAHSAWDELAEVLLELSVVNEEQRIARLLEVVEMWERGAGRLDRAFALLRTGFLADPDQPQILAALIAIADRHQAHDRLIAIYEEGASTLGSLDRTVRLLLEVARLLERGKQWDAAERRYQQVLGIRPDCEEALERLEAIYRDSNRLPELAALLERRLQGLMERLPPGEPRKQRSIELATVYERMESPYEALTAWSNVAREWPDHVPTYAALARLYEKVGQWSKVIEAMTREIDLTEAGGAEIVVSRVRQLRRRVAEILEVELELPERALEAYKVLDDGREADVEAAVERLCEKLGRHRQLDSIYARRAEAISEESELGQLLERRAALLLDKLNDPEGAAAVLRRLRSLRPDDVTLLERLDGALARLGAKEERSEVLRARIELHGKLKEPERQARSLVALGLLEADRGRPAEAAAAFERALDLIPSDPEALAELARLREGGADWDGYAAARERAAEVATSGELAVAALVDAARVHELERRDDASAKRCLEKALSYVPHSASALSTLRTLLRRLGDDVAADSLAERELLLDLTAERRAELNAGLGASALRRGELERAGRAFREAIVSLPGYPPAVSGLADLASRAGDWEEMEALLMDAASREGLPAKVAAEFRRRLAEAQSQMGRFEEAYAALLEADRLQPGELITRLLLGDNRFKINRFREAAQFLGQVAEHPDAPRLGAEAAEAIYHGALAEQKLRRPDRAFSLLEMAVRIDPTHVESLGLLAERALEIGDDQSKAKAFDLLERQARATRTPAECARRWERLGDLLGAHDAEVHRVRARDACERALEALGDQATAELLEKTLRLERETGSLEKAAENAARLLAFEGPPKERARRLREAAALDAALGRTDVARGRLMSALEIDPLEHETLAGLSAMLVAEGSDEQAAQLLTRALALMPPPPPSERSARAALWTRLGECREHLREQKGAMQAFEKALEADPSRRPLREILLERYGDDPANDALVRQHRKVLLADDPLHLPSLRALYRIDSRTGGQDSRRWLELLEVAGALEEHESYQLEATMPPETDEALGSFDEGDHALLAHADAAPLREVFAALYEGMGVDGGPDLDAVGVQAEDRISPVATTDLARAFSLCARALGNRKTGLYFKPDRISTQPLLIGHPPTALVVGPALTEKCLPREVRFFLGRALELARPEYILAICLEREHFTRLFTTLLGAFHPRHARRPAASEAMDETSQFRRSLPYKIARRLAEFFSEHGNVEFSSALWRRAVQHTGNRAGLLAAGDLTIAARVLRAEGDEEGLRDLIRFATSDTSQMLRRRLYGAARRGSARA